MGRCSSTRSGRCRPRCRPSCCASCRTASSRPWARRAPAGSTCASSRRRTARRRGRGPGRLRSDLLARLGAEPIRLPPLRDRIEDLGAAVPSTCWARADKPFETMAFQALCLHTWPGNVRELAKVLETAATLAEEEDMITIEHLPSTIAQTPERLRYTPHNHSGRPPPTPGRARGAAAPVHWQRGPGGAGARPQAPPHLPLVPPVQARPRIVPPEGLSARASRMNRRSDRHVTARPMTCMSAIAE